MKANETKKMTRREKERREKKIEFQQQQTRQEGKKKRELKTEYIIGKGKHKKQGIIRLESEMEKEQNEATNRQLVKLDMRESLIKNRKRDSAKKGYSRD